MNVIRKTLVKLSKPFSNSLQVLFQSGTEWEVMFAVNKSPHSI